MSVYLPTSYLTIVRSWSSSSSMTEKYDLNCSQHILAKFVLMNGKLIQGLLLYTFSLSSPFPLKNLNIHECIVGKLSLRT